MPDDEHRAYYNEIDPYCVGWLRNLISAGLIPKGDVDDRSIARVSPEDLEGYTQVHFFAGLGGWAYALGLAGWPEEREIWTGSCPCQPFSCAGKRGGVGDERHLWPEFRRLVRARKPATVFGEQVASKDGREWLNGVRTDLEELGYGVGAADLCAAGEGAPHIRQRLWWVALSDGRQSSDGDLQRSGEHGQQSEDGGISGMGNAECTTGESRRITIEPREGNGAAHARASIEPGRSSNPWSIYDLIPCLDGKARRVEPGTFPLAHGVPARMGKLRAYGNAIVAQVAAEFVMAYLEAQVEMARG